MRTTNRQERQTFSYNPAIAQLPDLLGHSANLYPTWPVLPAWTGEWTEEGHGLWMNGGNRLTLFCSNPAGVVCQIQVWRQATPLADWTLNTTVPVATGTRVTQQIDLGGYAVRALLFSNDFATFDIELSAIVQSVP
jgi:hypothetical protein